jgi:3-oxosteroid 1-dehydrogenase
MAPSSPQLSSEEVDFICVGSGAASLAAAVRAHDLGAQVLVLEASEKYGGSTAISGGVVWIPDNDQLSDRGIPDSREDALAYLRHLTLGRVQDERIVVFVDHAPRMARYMAEKTWLKLDSLEEYSDYYREAPGGKPGGRSMEPVPFDASLLGEHFATLRRPHKQSQIMGMFGISAREAHGLLVPSWKGTFHILGRMLQYFLRWPTRRRFSRDTKLHAGNALIGRLRKSLLERGVEIRLGAPVKTLIQDGDRITGVVYGDDERVLARRGVLLGAGGFERNGEMRSRYQRQPTDPSWNAGNPRNMGDGIRMGIEVGAQIDMMDEAWWTPVTLVPRAEMSWVLVVEKSLPGSLMVNADGERFCNEAAPYLDIGKAMYDGNAVPNGFLIFDAEFRRRYPVGPCAPGYAMPDERLPRRLREGFLIKADSIADLASQCGLSAESLCATVERFNTMSDVGVDEDFKRGDLAYDRYYADHSVKPNPTMRALRKGPFYAIRVYPGDLGTKGGLVTDPQGRVLREDGAPIPGLFASGNTTASMMGPTYPGAGGTIGPALTFGFLAAEVAMDHPST